MTRNDMSVPPMPRVRRSVWVIFAVAIAFAMIVPTVDFFAQWQAPVVLSVTLSTRQPALGQPVQLVVVLRRDHAAIAQQGKLLVTPAMVGMAIGGSITGGGRRRQRCPLRDHIATHHGGALARHAAFDPPGARAMGPGGAHRRAATGSHATYGWGQLMRASLAPLPMRRGSALPTTMTTFEQVLIANSAIIVAGTLVTFLFTRLSREPWHYLIATGCVVGITIAGVLCNAWLLRNTFAPLFSMLTTIQEVQHGAIEQHVTQDAASADIAQLAQAFNMMLDSLDGSRRAALLAVAQAQEDERRHIALELHDATGQELTGLLLRLEMVRQDLDEDSPISPRCAARSRRSRRRHARRLPACNRWRDSCARPSSTIWDSNPRFGAWSTSWGRRQSTSARWSSSLMAGAPRTSTRATGRDHALPRRAGSADQCRSPQPGTPHPCAPHTRSAAGFAADS